MAQIQQVRCMRCGAASAMHSEPIKVKRRVKFGATWVLATIFTGGLALVLYLIWPRYNQVVGYRQTWKCTICGATL